MRLFAVTSGRVGFRKVGFIWVVECGEESLEGLIVRINCVCHRICNARLTHFAIPFYNVGQQESVGESHKIM